MLIEKEQVPKMSQLSQKLPQNEKVPYMRAIKILYENGAENGTIGTIWDI